MSLLHAINDEPSLPTQVSASFIRLRPSSRLHSAQVPDLCQKWTSCRLLNWKIGQSREDRLPRLACDLQVSSKSGIIGFALGLQLLYLGQMCFRALDACSLVLQQWIEVLGYKQSVFRWEHARLGFTICYMYVLIVKNLTRYYLFSIYEQSSNSSVK